MLNPVVPPYRDFVLHSIVCFGLCPVNCIPGIVSPGPGGRPEIEPPVGDCRQPATAAIWGMSESDAVLFANEAFYRAFADRDPDAMVGLWSKSAPVSCLHPGWGPLFGRDEVLQSWLAIIRNPDSPAIGCHAPAAQLYGGTATVICFEEILGNFLLATNVFVREGRLWKMVHHQAGPTASRPEPEADAPRGPVN